MFTWLLNFVYLALVTVASPFLLWAAVTKGKYREGFAEKFLGSVPSRPEGTSQHLWLHAVSVGEVNLLAPLIKELQQAYPGVTFHITTTTKAGHELALTKYAQHTVSYAPLDFSWAIHRAYRRIQPDAVLLAELELWPNLVRFADRHDAKIGVVNGRLSEKSHRGYRRIRFLVGALLQQLDWIGAQDETYAARFIDLGANPDKVQVTGSIKFDGITPDRQNPQTQAFGQLAGLAKDDIVWLAGSTQNGEEIIILEAFQAAQKQVPSLKLLLVPRHPHRFDEVATYLQSQNVPFQRRSQLTAERCGNGNILLVDSVGELSAWWGAADIAFVGGSLGNRGGQNMIEPAAYGAAVAVGPNTWNFKDVVERLEAADSLTVVHDAESLAAFVVKASLDTTWRQQQGKRAREVVLAQQGATARTIHGLKPLLDPPKIVKFRTAA
ncbi:3-deoxy-D-manno-octulosonic acid transferase [Bremerella volcania]|uniref:3-deoxy-D-manno-octulosonic acid transferase n=1 Tax=Bremerella volcania TaxID=2527984 RepID=A0A518C4E5_9BACT|nr:3-deoxy-D-manno-octulosonic acid transferase [Bremerella volcania]QDU74102.1 3-deoxy-D-manno-octulosonic acid transferase [Bremerella volcania]